MIALDIGNTNAKAARWTGTAWTDRQRWPSTPDALRAGLRAYLASAPIGSAPIGSAPIGSAPIGSAPIGSAPIGAVSVVPALAEVVEAEARARGVACRHVRATDPDLPLRIGYHTPETLGADRIAAACAAHAAYGTDASGLARAVLVIDAGTACTLDVVDAEGVYRGGAIAPGPGLLAQVLGTGTAQLPHVETDWPGEVIGRSTREAIQVGIMVGFAGAVDRLLAEAEAALGTPAVRVATGGHARLLAERVRFDAVESDLVLDGVRLVAGPSLG